VQNASAMTVFFFFTIAMPWHAENYDLIHAKWGFESLERLIEKSNAKQKRTTIRHGCRLSGLVSYAPRCMTA
jgi:hypothetical protein